MGGVGVARSTDVPSPARQNTRFYFRQTEPEVQGRTSTKNGQPNGHWCLGWGSRGRREGRGENEEGSREEVNDHQQSSRSSQEWGEDTGGTSSGREQGATMTVPSTDDHQGMAQNPSQGSVMRASPASSLRTELKSPLPLPPGILCLGLTTCYPAAWA